MDTRQLEFFVAAAEELNFTRAAERSFVSQPGLSASIRALERELRARLFDRGASGATLTEAGSALLPRARRMLADARAVQDELLAPVATPSADDAATAAPATSAPPAVLRLGAEQCLGDLVDLVDLVTSFGARHPEVQIAFEQAPSGELAAKLAAGSLDVALIAQAVDEQTDARPATLLRRESFVLLAAVEHPLASGGVATDPAPLTWADLRAQRFVDLAPAWAARSVLDRGLAAAGLERESAVSVGDVHMLIGLVRRGFGVAAVPESIAGKPDAEGLPALPIVDPVIEWQVVLQTADGASAAARAFAAELVPLAEVVATRGALVEVL